MKSRWLQIFHDGRKSRREALETVYERALQPLLDRLAEYDRTFREFKSNNGILIGEGTLSNGVSVPVRLRSGSEAAHWACLGATGTGKSTWMANILEQEINQAATQAPFEKPSKIPRLFVGGIDCKGDWHRLVLQIIAAAHSTIGNAAAEALQAQVVIIDPATADLPPFNVCRLLPGASPEFQAYETTLVLQRMFSGELTSHGENILRHVLLLLTGANLSLVEAPLILEDEFLRSVLASRSGIPSVKEFFLRDYGAIPEVSKRALLNKLQALLLPEAMRLMFGADDIIDLRSIFEQGRPLFIRLGRGLSLPEEQLDIFGSLFLQFILLATYARRTYRPYILLIDEFARLLSSAALIGRFETALRTVRSYGLHLFLSFHNSSQLPSGLRETIIANADQIAIFRTNVESASGFGRFLPAIDVEREIQRWAAHDSSILGKDIQGIHRIERLPDRSLYWYDRRAMQTSILLKTTDFVSPHRRLGISENELEQMVRSMSWPGSAQHTIARAKLKEQIRFRQDRLREIVHPKIEIPPSKSVKRMRDKRSKGPRPQLG
jgi:hypothetical protein